MTTDHDRGVLENASYQLRRSADMLERFAAGFQQLQMLRDGIKQDSPYEHEWLIKRLDAILGMVADD